MKFFKSKISMTIVSVILIAIICLTTSAITKENIRKVGSSMKLEWLYDNGDNDELVQIFAFILKPLSIFHEMGGYRHPSYDSYWYNSSNNKGHDSSSLFTIDSVDSVSSSSGSITNAGSSHNSNTSKLEAGTDYSTTNVQVENVDEADIIKTDGEYIYSLSNQDVIITDVRDEKNPVVVAKIENSSTSIVPEEMMVYEDKLVLISEEVTNSYKKNNSTLVEIYDISNRKNPRREKSYSIKYCYYTSRLTNGKLYVISTGYMKKANSKLVTYYTEDMETKDIGYKNMYYFKDRPSSYMTTIASFDLTKNSSEFKVSAYLTDVDNIYVSEDNIYLADEHYDYDDSLGAMIGQVFGLRGIWAAFTDNDYDYNAKTTILKFNMKADGKVKYSGRQTIEGKAVDQFSFDEYASNLRVALKEDDGSKIVVLNEKMKVIGETDPVEEDEKLYSTRFMGDRAYFVTYRTIDPLFTFDLSNPKKPKLMGELKIPGYSVYLHPYDKDHIIGIGFQTKENVRKNSEGKVISISSSITGMKMSLFDVSDIKNPKQISEVEIGDAYTKSAILTNHKALLFSKEKELIAIPVTSYKSEMSVPIDTDADIDDIIDSYSKTYDSKYISEGYLVYNINLEDGIKLKGVITHSAEEDTKGRYNYSGNLLRGVYIKDNLFTVSQIMLKVNKLDTLEKVSSIEI